MVFVAAIWFCTFDIDIQFSVEVFVRNKIIVHVKAFLLSISLCDYFSSSAKVQRFTPNSIATEASKSGGSRGSTQEISILSPPCQPVIAIVLSKITWI